MTETEQFEQFMRNYQNMVFSTAVRLLANEAEAQDISQEVFLKAYSRWQELSVSPTAGGWLKAVTTNLCLNHLSRYRNRWKFFSELFRGEDEEDDKPPVDLPIGELTTDELNETDQKRILEEALFKLPPGQRVPLVLYHFEEKSYEEIAATMRISLSKVKTDIMRGREALKRKLLQGSSASKELATHYGETRSNSINISNMTRLLSPTLL
jgi:RNA polymerase sigma-70 factor (ECF subfamily)